MSIACLMFLQSASTIPPADFIRDHSTLVSWFIGLLIAVVVAQAVAAIAWIHKEFTNLKDADAAMAVSLGKQIIEMTEGVNRASIGRYDVYLNTQKTTDSRLGHLDERVTNVEKTLEVYREHVGAGDIALKRIADSQERQMTALEAMKLENVGAHAAIIAGRTGLLERLTAVEARAEALMQRISAVNGTGGDLKVVAETLQLVAKRLETVAEKVAEKAMAAPKVGKK